MQLSLVQLCSVFSIQETRSNVNQLSVVVETICPAFAQQHCSVYHVALGNREAAWTISPSKVTNESCCIIMVRFWSFTSSSVHSSFLLSAFSLQTSAVSHLYLLWRSHSVFPSSLTTSMAFERNDDITIFRFPSLHICKFVNSFLHRFEGVYMLK